MFVGGDPDRPLVLGVVRGSGSSGRLPGSVSEITSALPAPEFDIERLLLSAKGQIVLRCGKASITLTRAGKIIVGAEVPLGEPWRGLDKLLRMAGMAVAECLEVVAVPERAAVPILLVTSELERPGRPAKLDEELLDLIAALLRVDRHPDSAVLPRGSVGGVEALLRARSMLGRGRRRVVVAGVDSLLSAPALRHFEVERRLLTSDNSNGFIPGEAAGALLVQQDPDAGAGDALACRGLGLGDEPADRNPELPLRADGLASAIRAALADSKLEWRDVDYRIADVSGEQRPFKEAALAILRLMRERKETFPIWHAADCVGEVGAASVPCAVAIALMAARKRYAPGPGALCHFANADGRRGAIVLRERRRA